MNDRQNELAPMKYGANKVNKMVIRTCTKKHTEKACWPWWARIWLYHLISSGMSFWGKVCKRGSCWSKFLVACLWRGHWLGLLLHWFVSAFIVCEFEKSVNINLANGVILVCNNDISISVRQMSAELLIVNSKADRSVQVKPLLWHRRESYVSESILPLW